MNRQKCILLAVTLVLFAATAALLSRASGTQKLGRPGVALAAEQLVDEEGNLARTNSVSLPAKVLDYESKLLPLTKIELAALPADTTFGRRSYEAPDGFYARMDAVLMGTDRTSIHKPQICLTAQGWVIEKMELVHIPVREPFEYQLPVMRLIAGKKIATPEGGEIAARAVFAYWFVAEDALTARHDERMWWLAKELLSKGVLQRWAYVTCLSICEPGAEERTFERIKELIAASVPQFQLVPRATNLAAHVQKEPK